MVSAIISSNEHVWFAGKPPQKVPPRERDQSNPTSGVETPRILIVEDEFFVAWHMQSMLRDLNFSVCEIASDAQSAIDRAIELQANLLLMDINLGEGPDGIEVVRRIREYQNAAVIFITAYTEADILSRIEEVFPDAQVLAKPLTADTIKRAILQIFPS